MADAVRYELQDGIATLAIDRPEKRNAMTYAVLGEFTRAIARASPRSGGRSRRAPSP